MKEQSTTKGFVILSMASIVVKILSLLYIPFLRVIIGDEGVGIQGAAMQMYLFVYVITNAGVPVAISKLISELTAVKNYKDAVKSFKIARLLLLLLGTIMSIIMMLFAYPLSKFMGFNKSYLAVLALSPAILFTSISSAYRGYFQGRGNMTYTAISQVLEQIFNTIFALTFAYLFIKYGVEAGCAGATIGTSVGAFIAATYLTYSYEKNKKFKVPKGYAGIEIERYTSKQLLKKIISYGLPITLCVGMTYAGNLVDVMNTKSRLLAAGISDINANILYGYLTKYQQLLNVPISIISSLQVAILPAIAAAAAVNNKKLVREKINYAFKLCFMIAIPSAVGLAVLSEPIFKTLKFGGGAYLMAYGSIVLVLMAIMQIQTTILQSLGKLYTATVFSVLGIIFKITANYFLISIPKINILGAVFGSIIGFIIPVVINHYMIKKTLHIKFSLVKHGVKPLIASTLMGLIVFVVFTGMNFIIGFIKTGYFSNAIATILAVIFGAFSYFYGLIITGGIREKDLDVLPQKLVEIIPSFMLEKVK